MSIWSPRWNGWEGEVEGVGRTRTEGEDGRDSLRSKKRGVRKCGRVGAQGNGQLAIGEPLMVEPDSAANDILVAASRIPGDADARANGPRC